MAGRVDRSVLEQRTTRLKQKRKREAADVDADAADADADDENDDDDGDVGPRMAEGGACQHGQ